jgi:hypothetical protein
MDAPTLHFRFTRDRDHDAIRRSGEAICKRVLDGGGMVDGVGSQVHAALHPALPPIEIGPIEKGVGALATTWPAGPGYHRAVIALMRGAAEDAGVDLAIADSTGFAGDADEKKMELAHVAHARAVGKRALEFFDSRPDQAHVQIGLALPGHLDSIRIDGDPAGIFTLEGVRKREWLEALAKDDRAAQDFLPWWNETLDDRATRRLGRALVESRLTWRPARSDRQRAIRGIALANLRRGKESATPEEAAILVGLETLARGEESKVSGLRILPRVAALGNGWSTVVPGHFEELLPDGSAPAAVTAGFVQVDQSVRLEPLSQAAPEGVPLAERVEQLFANPAARDGAQRRESGFAGFMIDRPLADGALMLIASFVGESSHLIARILVSKGGDLGVARKIFAGISPSRSAENLLQL